MEVGWLANAGAATAAALSGRASREGWGGDAGAVTGSVWRFGGRGIRGFGDRRVFGGVRRLRVEDGRFIVRFRRFGSITATCECRISRYGSQKPSSEQVRLD